MDGEGDIATVSKIAPQHWQLGAPDFLRDLQGWCLWRYEDNPGKPKPRKVPYWTGGGRRYRKHGSPEDREQLTSFAAARDAAIRRGFDGVGFALLPEWHITALDFDDIVGKDGEIPGEIAALVNQTYCEYSPSGNGIRAFFKGDLGSHSARPTATDCEFSTYNVSGFVTVTSQPLPITEMLGFENHIADADDALRAYCERRFGPTSAREKSSDDFMAGHEPRIGMTAEEIEETVNKLDPSCGRDDWIRVGMALHHECEGDDTGLDIWDQWSCIAENYISRHDLESQWYGFTRRQGTGTQITMRSVLKMVKDLTIDIKAVVEEAGKLVDPSRGIRTPEGYEGKFLVVTAKDLLDRPPLQWLIKGVLPKAEIGMIYGPSGSGKSFVLINLLGAITRGIEWRDRKVRKGRTILIAAEGGASIGKRIDAYARHAKIEVGDVDIGIITMAPNLLVKEDVAEVIKAVIAAGGADVVAIDTMAQTTPGANENSSEDMGTALANAKLIHEATGALVLIVHHTGKDAARGSRGWSGIKGALDVEIEIIRDEDSPCRQIHISKMRDGEDGLRFGFKLDVVEMGMDADGDSVTSCAVLETDLQPVLSSKERKERSGVEKLGSIERHLLEVIEQCFPDESRTRYDSFVDKAVEAMSQDDDKRDTRKQRVVRAIEGLAKKKDGPLSVVNGNVIFYV